MKKKVFLGLFIILGLFVFTGCGDSKKEVLVENTDYFLRGELTGAEYLDITKRGYYVDTLDEGNASYFYIICMGEKNTGGYRLEVKEVSHSDKGTEIVVEEIAPSAGDIVTEAFTYPTVMVEFSDYQKDIVIKNTKGEEFPLLTIA